jgi:3-phosphoshikimate 1-carboxyvinyltransferase
MRVLGGGLRPRPLALDARVSSQYATALLLVAPRIGGLDLTLLGPVVSRPYLRLTIDVLAAFGIAADVEGLAEGRRVRIRVPAGAPAAARVRVPPDASAAACWWAAAALAGGEVATPGLSRSDAQADLRLLAWLEQGGAVVEETPLGLTVRAPGGRTSWPAEVDLGDAPDLVPLVGALAAHGTGRVRIRGAGHARWKESDRLQSVAAAIRAVGGEAEVEDGELAVTGRALRPGRVDVAGDHRIAFAFGVLGLVVPGITLVGAEAAEKSHPAFLADLARAARGGGPGDG